MTYRPIPEERRRELAAFVHDLAEEHRRTPYIGHTAERDFWNVRIPVMAQTDAFPTSPSERLWLIRHAHLAVTGTDPIRVPGFQWPGFCVRTGPIAVIEGWPLEPIPRGQGTPERAAQRDAWPQARRRLRGNRGPRG